MVEGARLLSEYRVKSSIQGSNPCLSDYKYLYSLHLMVFGGRVMNWRSGPLTTLS